MQNAFVNATYICFFLYQRILEKWVRCENSEDVLTNVCNLDTVIV